MLRSQPDASVQAIATKIGAGQGTAVTPVSDPHENAPRSAVSARPRERADGNWHLWGDPGASHFRRRPPRLPPPGGPLRLPAWLRASSPVTPHGPREWRILAQPGQNRKYGKWSKLNGEK